MHGLQHEPEYVYRRGRGWLDGCLCECLCGGLCATVCVHGQCRRQGQFAPGPQCKGTPNNPELVQILAVSD